MNTLYVLTNGFVVVIGAKDSFIIRRWGTTQGVGQLKDGPLPGTVKDSIPLPCIREANIIFSFTVTGW